MKAPQKISPSIADFIGSLENLATLNGQLTLKSKQERSISCFTGLLLKFASNLLTWNYISNIFVLLIAAAVPSARHVMIFQPGEELTMCAECTSVKKMLIRPKKSHQPMPCLSVCGHDDAPPPNPTCCWEIQCSSHKESCPLFQMYFVTSALHQRAAKTRVLRCHGGRKINLQICISCPADAPVLSSRLNQNHTWPKIRNSSWFDWHSSRPPLWNGSCVWTSADRPGLPPSPEATFYHQRRNREAETWGFFCFLLFLLYCFFFSQCLASCHVYTWMYPDQSLSRTFSQNNFNTGWIFAFCLWIAIWTSESNYWWFRHFVWNYFLLLFVTLFG